MLKRLHILALATLSQALAASLRAGPLGAVIVSWDIDSAKNTVTLHMVNNSGKDITFYNISIKETYGQDVDDRQYSEDLLGIMLRIKDPADIHRDELRQMYGNGTWEAGTPREQVLIVRPGLTGYEAVLDAVTYADNTAQTTNPDALQRELTARESSAQTLLAANDAIKHALSNPTDQSPNETAKKEIEDLRTQWEVTRTGHFNPGPADRVILELDDAPHIAAALHQTLSDHLNYLVARNSRRAAWLLEHAAPKVEGAN